MPGFQYRYRLSGGPPTIQSFASPNGDRFTAGDMVGVDDTFVRLGATGGAGLLGAAVDGRADADQAIQVITDADAVYGVEDANPRAKDDRLDLTGTSGAQGIAPTVNADLTVVLDCSDEEETLVRITIGNHRTLADHAGAWRSAGGELNAAIARMVVRYHNQQLGRGPTKAKAFHRDNVIVVVLQDAMTKAERSLAAGGKQDAVMQMRAAFQETMRPGLVVAVEDLTGCKVEAFMSANHVDPDMATEIFVLDRPVPGQSAGTG
jgi:uncharacterized protein YbcI